jgi:2-polyprenyl-3-methyl-5-hydroxy-6-metoxy-1,4-benzoquinol methylase
MDPRIENINFYNQIAEQSFIEWFNNETLLPLLREFIGLLPNNPKVLDLGCGTGGESKRLINLGANITGIDISSNSISFAKEHLPEGVFINDDIIKHRFDKNEFDGVLDSACLFHFPENEQNEILNNIHAYIKDDGILLSINPEGNIEGFEERQINGKVVFRYVNRVEKTKWIKQVEGKGFRYIKELQFGFYNFKTILFRNIK